MAFAKSVDLKKIGMETSSRHRVESVHTFIQFMSISELESVIRACNQKILHLVQNGRKQSIFGSLAASLKGHHHHHHHHQEPKATQGAHNNNNWLQKKQFQGNGHYFNHEFSPLTENLIPNYQHHDDHAVYDDDPELAIAEFTMKWNSSYRTNRQPQGTLNDFLILKTVGKGAFGRVLLAQHRNTGQFYAMKVIEKSAVIVKNNVEGILNEKRTLESVKHPFLVQLQMHFQDSVNLYIIMEFVGGGDLFFHLKRRHRFTESVAKFYGGQIVLALGYLHNIHIVYRDLKPENILISSDGYIKLTDFGACKRLKKSTGSTTTMFGTAEYMAPEIFLQRPYGKSVDYWALGILFYEMVHGESPFRSNSDTETYEKILGGKIKFVGQLSSPLKHLITNLLKDDPAERYGAESVDEVKNHPWFASVDWKALLHKQIPPPFVPKLAHRGDSRFFDKFEEKFADSLNEPLTSQPDVYKDVFRDF